MKIAGANWGSARSINLNDFNFIKLVQAIQSSYIFTIRTGFTTETLRISHIFNREISFFQQQVTINIGNRNFGGRDKVKIIQVGMIHLAVFIR